MSPQRLQGGGQHGPAMLSFIVAAYTALDRAPRACRFATAPDARRGRGRHRQREDARTEALGRPPPSGPVPGTSLPASHHGAHTSTLRAAPPSMRHPKSQRHAPAPLAAIGLAQTSAASAQSCCCDRCATVQSSRACEQRPIA
ncbi:uncharacterized protein CC84DRAFT_1179395 [Paraphaeosphaeria sporulosa]|uniref:Uncharacterized protein n=1 Tax=Paraphaeosphaeria sporulosa TaxID=1460663 RepID=A0A177C2Z9_9PLEO|nr:uncharacterized protein CC84DRAFT_1179395 [Paraphaeosphaeria sporulosa]OAG01289.1 hypothetical protein CC84DRAFT_1179395 [Paraphaeosphaeria sporulosa]